MLVEVINVGTELLRGFAVNTHVVFLGQHLRQIGATLSRQISIPDRGLDIEHAIREAMQRTDLVISTGGLGPTSDDITRDLVVQMLGLKTRVDERVLENIRTRFRRRGMEMPDSVKCQAIVPETATVLYNEHGTAPGLAIPTSHSGRCRWLILLPGPPREMRPMFEDQVLPLLKREFQAGLPTLDCRVFKVVGKPESVVEGLVAPVLNGIPDLEIGYCARSGEVDVRLIVQGGDKAKVKRLADEAESRVRQVLGDAIFGTGSVHLEECVVRLLKEKRKFVTTAESCTGGFLAHRITLVSGSSEIFREGWITYSNEAKSKALGVPGHLIVEYGAVSQEVAKAMAEGALQKARADYAIAITGIAGPTGGTPEKPVGTVFIALSHAGGSRVEHHCLMLDRETFKFAATQAALNMLRKELLNSNH